MLENVLIVVGALLLGAAGMWLVLGLFRRSHKETIVHHTIAERVRAVGKLVGLEVAAKEIVTQTSGWSWMPPLLLSQARIAMIFHFEKQYSIDLSRVRDDDIEQRGENSYRVSLPPIDGTLRLIEVTPYDIQDGKVLGLLDVIPMKATRQRELMEKAQISAAELYESNDPRYLAEARTSIERHLRSLMELFGIEVELYWPDKSQKTRLADPAELPVETTAGAK